MNKKQTKMFFKKNWIALIVITLMLILIAVIGLVGFFYINEMREQNKIERQKISSEERIRLEEIQNEKDIEQEKQRADAEEKKSNEQKLNLCLLTAQSNYSSNWDKSCTSISTQNENNYKDCLGKFSFSTESYCRSLYPQKKSTDCSLPTDTATRWDENHKDEKNRCYELYSN